MADKILRPITDVEVVEQMAENDTVLIEQNGEIKRTKGVVGGDKKYIIVVTFNPETESESCEWRGEHPDIEKIAEMIENGIMPDVVFGFINPDISKIVESARIIGAYVEYELDGTGNIVGILGIEFYTSNFGAFYKSDGTFEFGY